MKLEAIAPAMLSFVISTPGPVLADISRPPPPGGIGTFMAAILVLLACVFGGLWFARRIRRKKLLEDHAFAAAKPSEPGASPQPASKSVRE